MLRVLVNGCNGQMGRVVAAEIARRDGMQVVAGIDPTSVGGCDFPVYPSPDTVEVQADVLIDFSSPVALQGLLALGAARQLPLVLCTTGYSETQVAAIRDASKRVPLFYSRNMSLGINLLIELSKKAAQILGPAFDVEIIEKHHNQKVDAPSGTALMLADAIASVRDGVTTYQYDRHAQRKKREPSEIGMHSVRGGTIVGEHEVLFAGHHETITLSHSAQSKEVFAAGAVNAAAFLVGKPAGLYDMSDLLK